MATQGVGAGLADLLDYEGSNETYQFYFVIKSASTTRHTFDNGGSYYINDGNWLWANTITMNVGELQVTASSNWGDVDVIEIWSRKQSGGGAFELFASGDLDGAVGVQQDEIIKIPNGAIRVIITPSI